MHKFNKSTSEMLQDFFEFSLDNEIERIMQPTYDLVQENKHKIDLSDQLRVRKAIERNNDILINMMADVGNLIGYLQKHISSLIQEARERDYFQECLEGFYLNFDQIKSLPQSYQRLLSTSPAIKLWEIYYRKSQAQKQEIKHLKNEIKQLRGGEGLQNQNVE